MLHTPETQLRVPELTDVPDITQLNPNWYEIDQQLGYLRNGKVDKALGKGLSTNDFTTPLKQKLDGVEVGANNYTPQFATIEEAQAGLNNTKLMTPKLTKEAILSLAGDGVGGVKNNVFVKSMVDGSFVATTPTTSFTIPSMNSTKEVLLYHKNLCLIEGEDFSIVKTSGVVTLNFTLATNETIFYTILETSYDYRDLINSPVGELTSLTTTNKSTIVEAINEVNGGLNNVSWNNLKEKPSTFPPSPHDHARIFNTDANGNIEDTHVYTQYTTGDNVYDFKSSTSVEVRVPRAKSSDTIGEIPASNILKLDVFNSYGWGEINTKLDEGTHLNNITRAGRYVVRVPQGLPYNNKWLGDWWYVEVMVHNADNMVQKITNLNPNLQGVFRNAVVSFTRLKLWSRGWAYWSPVDMPTLVIEANLHCDFNDLTVTGKYFFGSNSIIQASHNAPIHSAGILEVMPIVSNIESGDVLQRYTEFSSCTVYVRRKYSFNNGGWSAWKKQGGDGVVGKQVDIHTIAKLSTNNGSVENIFNLGAKNGGNNLARIYIDSTSHYLYYRLIVDGVTKIDEMGLSTLFCGVYSSSGKDHGECIEIPFNSSLQFQLIHKTNTNTSVTHNLHHYY